MFYKNRLNNSLIKSIKHEMWWLISSFTTSYDISKKKTIYTTQNPGIVTFK